MISNFYVKSNIICDFNLQVNSDMEYLIDFLIERGYSPYPMEQKRGQLVPYHSHPSEEMVIVVKGSVRYVIEEEIVDLYEGDIIRIAPMSAHAMIGIGSYPSSKLLLAFI